MHPTSLNNPHPKSVAFGAQTHACITRLDEGLRKQIVDTFMANMNKCRQRMASMHDADRKSDLWTYSGQLVKPEVKGLGSDEWGGRKLKPIMARDMTLNMTHRGKVFRGRICGSGAHFVVASTVMLVEDLCGDLVVIAIYNMPRAETDAPNIFPEGLEIEVKEPFYKSFSDGSEGIRIDNPEEIRARRGKPIFAEKDEYECWKSRGNDVFSSADSKFGYIAALGCYDRALEAPDCGVRPGATEDLGNGQTKNKMAAAQCTAGVDGLPLEKEETAKAFMVKLLNNVSVCLRQVGQLRGSACFAAVAAVLDEESVKAHYRLVDAMLREDTLDTQLNSSWLSCIATTALCASDALQEHGVSDARKVADIGHRALDKLQEAPGEAAKLKDLGIGAWAAFLMPWESHGVSLVQVSTPYASAEDVHDLPAAELGLLRQEGLEKFRARDVKGALRAFMHLFQSVQAQDFCNKASVICLNRSIVHLRRGDVGRALGNAAVSILLSPHGYASCSVMAVLREAKAYEEVADSSRALGALDRGIRAQPPACTGEVTIWQ